MKNKGGSYFKLTHSQAGKNSEHYTICSCSEDPLENLLPVPPPHECSFPRCLCPPVDSSSFIQKPCFPLMKVLTFNCATAFHFNYMLLFVSLSASWFTSCLMSVFHFWNSQNVPVAFQFKSPISFSDLFMTLIFCHRSDACAHTFYLICLLVLYHRLLITLCIKKMLHLLMDVVDTSRF